MCTIIYTQECDIGVQAQAQIRSITAYQKIQNGLRRSYEKEVESRRDILDKILEMNKQ